jgi:hypothetical protein
LIFDFMNDTLKKDLEQQVQNLYGPLEAANIALHNSSSVADARVVQALEEQINTLVDALIALDTPEHQD